MLRVGEGATGDGEDDDVPMTEEKVKQQANGGAASGEGEGEGEGTGEGEGRDGVVLDDEEKKILSGNNIGEEDQKMQELILRQQNFAAQAIRRIRAKANRAVARIQLLKSEEESLKSRKKAADAMGTPAEPHKPTLEQ